MIVIAGILIGAGLGWRSARRLRGSRLDQAQYAAVGAIIGAILGLALAIGIQRLS